MRKTNNIGYFIISHGRPNEQLTYNLFISSGISSADIFIVCDNLDETLQEYIANYKDNVLIFDKQKYMDLCDGGVQKPTGIHAVYARNAAIHFAKTKGYQYFVVADDDIKSLHHRVNENEKLKAYPVKNINDCFSSCIDFMNTNTHLSCIGFGTNNTFIGGTNAAIYKRGFDYMAVNIALYRAETPIQYASECQEDLIASILNNSVGNLVVSIPFIMVDAIVKGRNKGGNEGHYAEENTYYRYFGTLIYAPASIRIMSKSGELVKNNKSNYYPMLLSDRWKK